MAGNASRITAFCRSYPNSSGCPWPNYTNTPYVDPCANADPFSIGTTNCKKYTAYVNGYPGNSLALISPRSLIVQGTPVISPTTYLGFTSTSSIPIYSSYTLDSSNNATFNNKIGFIMYNIEAIYDTPTISTSYTGPATITANATVSWLDTVPDLRASAQFIFTYHLSSTQFGTAYPGSFNTNSTSTGQQLYGQKLLLNSSVSYIPSPSAPASIINTLVFNIV